MNTPRCLVAAAAFTVLALPSQAASIFLTPSEVATPPGAYSFQMFMNFSEAEATLGGSIDFDLQGPLSSISFMPSTWFTTTPDPAFTGFGTANANNEYQVHFGNFGGLSGNNLLGTITVQVTSAQVPASIVLAPTTFYGGFFSVSGAAQAVQMTGVTINAIPEPATAALWLLGAVVVAGQVRRRRRPVR